jgi:hypothetical protein
VVAVALLLTVFGSAWLALPVAVLVIVPFEVGFTTIVTVALDPLARPPRAHVTRAFAGLIEQVPWDVETDPNPAFFGSASMSLTPVAAEGPPFATTTE